ncbi:MAG: LuxR C-terminal-related transcriptional regulator [Acidimicrobiia bacterium]|nr:LuxR C-terminal-related transcriptional regulator [Acidimicrobiia bacterium]
MDLLLLILGIVNGVLFAVLGVQSWRLGRRITSPRARAQADILALVCAAFVLASTLRIGLQLVEVGALRESIREVVVTWVQFITSAGALLVIIPALWMLRRLTAIFARTDQFVTVLTDKVTLDASVSEAGLTARELEVLQHLAEGTLSDAELAEALYISPATAATHVRNIMKKTGVNRRHELMLLAVDNPGAAGG